MKVLVNVYGLWSWWPKRKMWVCIVTELKAACHFAGVCFSLVGSDGGEALPGCFLFSTWQQGFEWIFFGS